MILLEKISFSTMNKTENFFVRLGMKVGKLFAICLIVFAFQGCEKEDLVAPNSPSMKKNTNYLESSYGFRQDGSPVLVKIGITDGNTANASFENKGDDPEDTITDKDGDDGDGDGDGDDDGVIDKDGDDEDGDDDGTID